ncbi:MAG: peptidylprolyl isomerase [Burkholderiales bacterium]|nr:peptidylprolyl isomerase [Burkholderiales bacterium]
MSGCGGGTCTCGGGGGTVQAEAPAAVAMVNGIALHEPGERLAPEDLRERAWAELLRQEAVRQGRLPRHPGLEAPGISLGDEAAIQSMLDEAVPMRQPSPEECERFYAARRQQYSQGRAARVRHILFAVTGGVDVNALAKRAEQALLELLHRDAPAARFAELARELSNCPSAAEDGELGWLRPEECAPELVATFFDEQAAIGLHPRLVHSRYGLHIVDVQERRAGTPVDFAQVRDRIAMELAQRSRATALHQYIRLLAGQARVEGVELDAAQTPLVQ